MASCEILMAEAVTQASFGRRNYYGVNPGRAVLVPMFPYQLHVTFLAFLRPSPNEAVKDLKLLMHTSWGVTHELAAPSPPIRDVETCHAIEWSRMDLLIPDAGEIKVTVSFEGQKFCTTWVVKLGAGPSRAAVTSLPTSAMVDGRRPWDHLKNLIAEVRSAFYLVDQYAPPTLIQELVPSNATHLAIRALVSEKAGRDASNDWKGLKKLFPGLEVRTSRLFHDRFVLRDDEEVFAFGHSLNALEKGRVSFFTRVYDEEQAATIRNTVAEVWKDAAVVL